MEKHAHTHHKASSAGTFLRGFRSGVVNSGIMLGIFSVIGFAASAITVGVAAATWPLGISAAIITTLTTGIFSGAMGVKKSHETGASSSHHRNSRGVQLVPVLGKSATPTMLVTADEPDMDLRNDWAERTGRGSASQTKVQQILANGSLSDKDRASAILTAREASADQSHSL